MPSIPPRFKSLLNSQPFMNEPDLKAVIARHVVGIQFKLMTAIIDSVVVFTNTTFWLCIISDTNSLLISVYSVFCKVYGFGSKLTGQGWSHKSPLHPAVHVQEPSAGWH